ncbi:MAG: M48 family metallopeptidase [Acidobacteria bacterium]|nr:M48 family metallopeptidase [Acidobacteriota bacterium]
MSIRSWSLGAAAAILLVGAATDIARPAEAPSVGHARSAAGAAPATLDDPAFRARAHAYVTGSYWILFAGSAITFAGLGWISLSGAATRASKAIEERIGPGPRQTVVFLGLLLAFLSLLSLPLDFYAGFVREHAYGFSTQTVGGWLADRVRDFALELTLATLFVLPVLSVIRRFPRSWWILGTIFACALTIVVVAVEPVFIAPLYNEFTPLQDEEIKRPILDLAHAHGVPAGDVYEMNASERSAHDNAYASGLLGTERIVLYDTLLDGYTKDEIVFVMGHEIGHRVLNHIWKGLALACLLILAGFYTVQRAMRTILSRERSGRGRIGVTSPWEPAAIPLMAFIVSIFMFVTLPIQSGWSRHLEAEADAFALASVPHPEVGPDAFRRMAVRNLSDPDPPAILEWLLYSHPSIGKRIAAAEEFLKK